jgi:hypothetical protein
MLKYYPYVLWKEPHTTVVMLVWALKNLFVLMSFFSSETDWLSDFKMELRTFNRELQFHILELADILVWETISVCSQGGGYFSHFQELTSSKFTLTSLGILRPSQYTFLLISWYNHVMFFFDLSKTYALERWLLYQFSIIFHAMYDIYPKGTVIFINLPC